MHILPRRTNLRILCLRPQILLLAYWPALLILCAAATADALTTLRNMQLYGPEIELHLVQRLVTEILGITFGVPAAKLIQLAFVLFVAAWWRPWCLWILWSCAALYTLAALSNHFLWL